jgi:hypothetical protein
VEKGEPVDREDQWRMRIVKNGGEKDTREAEKKNYGLVGKGEGWRDRMMEVSTNRRLDEG